MGMNERFLLHETQLCSALLEIFCKQDGDGDIPCSGADRGGYQSAPFVSVSCHGKLSMDDRRLLA